MFFSAVKIAINGVICSNRTEFITKKLMYLSKGSVLSRVCSKCNSVT